MGSYVWIAVGSALGGMARYWCAGVAARLIGETFPRSTLTVNVIGSFVIGLLDTLTGPEGRVYATRPRSAARRDRRCHLLA
jgi:CrcB protein